jgi:hypothetical protein
MLDLNGWFPGANGFRVACEGVADDRIEAFHGGKTLLQCGLHSSRGVHVCFLSLRLFVDGLLEVLDIGLQTVEKVRRCGMLNKRCRSEVASPSGRGRPKGG